jgi:hypothetical protein
MNEGNNLFIFPLEYIRVVGGDLGIYIYFFIVSCYYFISNLGIHFLCDKSMP